MTMLLTIKNIPRMLTEVMLFLSLQFLIPSPGTASPLLRKAIPPPDTPAICLVTVDTGLVKNIIVWHKTNGLHIRYFKIYKENNGLNNWDSIGYRPFDSLSYFIDTSSLPRIKAAKYRLSAVDSNGNESALSPYHRTINLAIQKANGWSFTLLWTPYEGFNLNYYRIWRWSLGNGWLLIDSVQSNTHSYTDNPPPGLVYYMVETSPPHPCQPSKAQTNYNTSRSNRASTAIYLTTEWLAENSRITLFPNPAMDNIRVTVQHPRGKHLTLDLYSASGSPLLHYDKVLCSHDICRITIDTKKQALPAGLYFVKITINNLTYSKKLIIRNP